MTTACGQKRGRNHKGTYGGNLPEPGYGESGETADEYLSGNVREKLSVARTFAENRPEYAINVTSLKGVQPKELDASEIEVRIGATWIVLTKY